MAGQSYTLRRERRIMLVSSSGLEMKMSVNLRASKKKNAKWCFICKEGTRL